ncbi:hypothetical protein [Novosphingobium sp.]|uniref:hypothetical protein n=1 Tax=Novosphingobium sp. TaxID=1874826 RepID=UPI0025E0E763|nr:hypothetical protein [Novosphingobium sp.]
MELGAIDPAREGSLMAAPSMVFAARFAANHLGIDIEVIEELAEQMEPEDGCLNILDSLHENAASVTGFTRKGLDFLEDLLDDRRSEFMKGI